MAALTDPAGAMTVRAGDKVRITAGRLSLGLLPVSDQTGGATPLAALSDAVRHGLNTTGRFHVVPRARLTIWLLERRSVARRRAGPRVHVGGSECDGRRLHCAAGVEERWRYDSCRASSVCTRSAADAGDHSPGRAPRSCTSAPAVCLIPRSSTCCRRFRAANPTRFAACRGGSDASDTGRRSQ